LKYSPVPPQKIRDAPARLDAGGCGFGQGHEAGGVEGFVQPGYVNEVMGDALLLGGRRLGRADIQAAIHLHGIDRNDFAADAFGQFQGDGGFARRRGAGQEHGKRIGLVFHL
jgi:hypothetical protein